MCALCVTGVTLGAWKLHGLQGVILGTYQQGRVDLMHLSLTALPSTGLCTPTQPPLYGCPPALSRLFTTEMFVPLWSRGDTQAPEGWRGSRAGSR